MSMNTCFDLCLRKGNYMKLTNDELKEIYFGALFFEETKEGYLQAFQYSKAQMDYFEKVSDFWFERCFASTAKTLEFKTDATKVSFDYEIIWEGSQDSFELAVDGLITDIKYVKDIKKKGRLEFGFVREGKESSDSNGSRKKDIIIYLPADATVIIKDFEIDGTYERAKKNEKVLWLGDSITQGFGPLRSGQTYVSVANRILNYDILNQGIGGYVYDKFSLMKMEGYEPDKIIVALGTNQYGDKHFKVIEDYYDTLISIYGDKIPILCILPLWRGDNPEGIPTLIEFCKKVKEIAERYENIKTVDGFKLVPHLPEYYLDDLHPNCLGAEIYGRNLVEAIRMFDF